ncbi:MAG: SDR family NAD(P)-dependent oxidoreductase [Deltaproteobacteria bacterium]|nr:SDR family NAD(P)-dependent oxidoreductase [Deltaproteobacteria bacterium]
MGLFTGKVVIVTGSGGGIGRAHALAFAKAGACVVVNDVGGARDGSGKDQRAADAVVEEIKAAGGEAVATYSSVADLDGADMILWSAQNRFKRVDVLVNNAGILRDRALTNMSTAEWDSVIDVHLKGSFLMTRAFARAIKTQGGGGYAVVNTTSVSGLRGNFGQANYAAAKAGIFGLTRVCSIEFEKLGCRVNAVAPVALTRMTEDVPRLQQQGIETLGPQHISPVALWLASDLARDVNGRVFGVHGPKVFEYRMSQSDGLDAAPGGGEWTPEMLAAELPRFALA